MKAVKKALLPPAAILVAVMGVCLGCDEAARVSLTDVEPTRTAPQPQRLRVAISAMISPEETLTYYTDILDYVSVRLDIPVDLVQRETYAEVNNLVKIGQIDMAFVCTGAYIDGHDEFGMELLVAPVAYGQPVYYSYIIVPAAGGVDTFEQLRGKRFAFTDPMSNTGKLYPTHMLAQMSETPETFFGSYTFTNSHDKSIKSVALKLVDGAAVDSLVWDYLNATNPGRTSMTRIVSKSEPFGIPPVIVNPDLDPALKGRLQEVLLHMHEDEEGQKLLARVKIDRFLVIEDSAYDSVRRMESASPASQ